MNQKYIFAYLNLMLILPLSASLAQVIAMGRPMSAVLLAKWLLFFAGGIRLLFEGLSQYVASFGSAESPGGAAGPGAANTCMGALAFCSLFQPACRVPAAWVIGGYCLLLAGTFLKRDRFSLLSNLVCGVLLTASAAALADLI